MNDLEYLNQISAGVKKPAVPTSLFDKKMKIVLGALLGVIVLLVVLITTVGTSSAPETTATSELGRLYVRSNELIKTITAYNGSVRSSSLRSTGTSFSTLLTDLSSTSSTYLTKTLGVDLATATPTENDVLLISKLNTSLETARLNGILDRHYASEMYYQIRYLITIESSVAAKTTDASLQSYLKSSTTSLSHLEDTFQNFSESN